MNFATDESIYAGTNQHLGFLPPPVGSCPQKERLYQVSLQIEPI